jgi:DNA-binding SARP family transcriptional activator
VGEDRRSASIGQTVAASLNIGLLGGFRVERADAQWPVCCWQRRSAKTLTKLLATYPRHALHREQVMEILWPNVDPASALNSFGKALYAARRAFQPDLLPRQSSAYLCLTDSMLALNTDRVTIDADRFQQLAESALKQCDIESYESALVAYGGELLPEDRYEDWCAERRDYLAGLHIRLLMELADALTHRGSLGAAIDRLHEVLRQDPTREDVHRHLMVLYAEMGSRDQAVRQFQLCEDALRRELGLAPERATLALHADVLEDRIPRRLHVQEPEAVASGRRPERSPERTRFVDRDAVLRMLGERLTRAHAGRGGTIVLSGEAGVGKTRVAAEFSAEAEGRGATVLSAGSGAHATELPYAPFAVALDRHITGRLDHGRVARVLSDLAEEQPVVLVLGDLHDFSRSSVDLLEHLAHLAGRRRWLILGTVREEELEVGNDVWSVIAQMTLEGLCERVTVRRLSRSACDDLVQALLPGGVVDEAVLAHIYARTLGNPLFVEELVHEMLEHGELLPARGRWRIAGGPSECVPGRVRTLVAIRAAPMAPGVRRVVALAAAAPEGEIPLDELRIGAAALDPPLSETELFDGLDRALEMRLLEERDGRYAFCHPLVRAALYEDLPRHRRDQLQAALAEAVA